VGFGSYKYVVRPGHGNGTPCSVVDGNCLTGATSGSISGTSGTIPLIPYNFPDLASSVKGEFTLLITNPGGSYGVCATSQDFTMTVVPDLTVPIPTTENITCNSFNDGHINLSVSGGKAPVMYAISGHSAQASPDFTNIGPGTYTISATDACGQQKNGASTVTVTEPVAIIAVDPIIGSATCNSPADGIIQADVTTGPGMYDYYLKLGASTVKSNVGSTQVQWLNNDLVAGNYTLQIYDSHLPACPPYSKAVQVNGPPVLSIQASNLQVNPVSCNSGSDGAIQLIGLDMSGSYQYSLVHQSDLLSVTHTTDPLFPNLDGNPYQLSVKRSAPTCNDKFTYPQSIIIPQPSLITIDLTKTDISCYGLTDGKINAVASGGTPGTPDAYTYQWETNVGSWSTINNTTDAIDNRTAGDYRIVVKDGNNCPMPSASITIIEPEQLVINEVNVHDLKCLGETGTIDIVSTGGVLPYTYEYSLNNSPVYISFDNTTPLDIGDYSVRVLDKNSCTTPDPGTYRMTATSGVLTSDYVVSDYNGFSISCFGGANGSVNITPAGGNGAIYAGYQFAFDNNPYQTEATLTGINAGTHTIRTQDARGCVLTKDILFTQTAEVIAYHLLSRKDVQCVESTDGYLEVGASGGLPPYTFNINNNSSLNTGYFSNLGIGSYGITITDKNKCATTYTDQIKSLTARMAIEAIIKNVSCFAGTDGTITALISSGNPPYQYAWAGKDNVSSVLDNIYLGTYALHITDQSGCVRDTTFTVTQPDQKLGLNFLAIPVCYQKTNGEIRLAASGGTPPYSYSINDGKDYQSTQNFSPLGLGTYPVKIRDSKNCITADQATIIQRSETVDPKFIIATKEHALDTLVITEVNVPKPDSISWMFDPNATILSEDMWQPQIKFNDPGTYAISMTAYFYGGCDYVVNRTLTIKPFDPQATVIKTPGYETISSFDITPNPNNGVFSATVKLNRKYNLSLIVYNMIGITQYSKNYESVQEVNEAITLDGLASGVYVIRAVTNNDAKDVRFVINK
jgi:hypothetical protein